MLKITVYQLAAFTAETHLAEGQTFAMANIGR
jgi:hypothetical protein